MARWTLTEVSFAVAAETNHHKLGGLKRQKVFLSQLWRLWENLFHALPRASGVAGNPWRSLQMRCLSSLPQGSASPRVCLSYSPSKVTCPGGNGQTLGLFF